VGQKQGGMIEAGAVSRIRAAAESGRHEGRLKQLAGEIAGGESAAQRPAGRPEIGGQ